MSDERPPVPPADPDKTPEPPPEGGPGQEPIPPGGLTPPPPAAPTPPKPDIDLRVTPSGDRPSTWQNLPPPEIVRAEPEPEKKASGKAADFFKSKAAMQIGGAIVGVALIAFIVWSFIPRSTTASHHGTLNLFGEAVVERDVAAMQSYCAGLAADLCPVILADVEQQERDHEVSRLASAAPNTGGPAGNRASATMMLMGEAGDPIMNLSMNLQRQEDGTWLIQEMVISETP